MLQRRGRGVVGIGDRRAPSADDCKVDKVDAARLGRTIHAPDHPLAEARQEGDVVGEHERPFAPRRRVAFAHPGGCMSRSPNPPNLSQQLQMRERRANRATPPWRRRGVRNVGGWNETRSVRGANRRLDLLIWLILERDAGPDFGVIYADCLEAAQD